MRSSLLSLFAFAAVTASGSPWHSPSSVLIALCWGVWAAVWLVGALGNARRGPAVRERSALGGFWLAGIVVVWLVSSVVPAADWRCLTFSAAWLHVAGALLLVCATAFTLWARVVLGAMWSSAPVIRDEHLLRTEGPYAITRHPIYTGMLGMLLGSAILAGLGRWAALFVVAVLIVTVKLRAEERLLGEAFGARYLRYRERVPQLVPGVRRLRTLRRR